MTVCARAPGSLLLVGEYAVLEEGGVGVSVAADVNASCTVSRADDPAIILRYGGEVARFAAPDEAGCSPVVAAVVDEVSRNVGEDVSKVRVELDTLEFYCGERKLGFGSSAAASVTLTAALLASAGLAPDAAVARSLDMAVGAHRRAQGGRGSGYDVATSFLGGKGLFQGGANPTIRPAALPWLPDCYVYRGPRAVSTPDAIGRFDAWKERSPAEAREFLSQSNAAAMDVAAARTWEDAWTALAQSKALSLELGCAIGVGADPSLYLREAGQKEVSDALASMPREDYFVKSLGAGNETGLLLVREPSRQLHALLVSSGLDHLEVSSQGVRIL